MATRQAEKHRAAQARLAVAVVPLVAHAWDTLLDPHDLRGSVPRLSAAIQAILSRYGRAAAAAGLTYYRNERRGAGIPGRPRLSMPPMPTAGDVSRVVEHAIHDLYGEWAPDALPGNGTPVPAVEPASNTAAPPATTTPRTPASTPEAPGSAAVNADTVQAAEDALASEVEQMVLDQSRLAVMNAAEMDQEAIGWARVTEPGACSFCRLLATRGAAYNSRNSADFRAHTKQPSGSGGTCRCHVEPAFHNYEMTAQARQDLADYRELTKEFGKSGRDLLIAWRQHVEGRPVTGPLVKPYTRSQ